MYSVNVSHYISIHAIKLVMQFLVLLDEVLEGQSAQLLMGGLAPSLAAHAHAVLGRGEETVTHLLMPQVEDASVRGPHHFHVALDKLPVQLDVLETPALDAGVKTPHEEKVRAIHTNLIRFIEALD